MFLRFNLLLAISFLISLLPTLCSRSLNSFEFYQRAFFYLVYLLSKELRILVVYYLINYLP